MRRTKTLAALLLAVVGSLSGGCITIPAAIASDLPDIHCVVMATPVVAVHQTNGSDPTDALDEPLDGVPAGETTCVTDENLAWTIATTRGTVIGKHWMGQNYTGSTLVAHAPIRIFRLL